jgi:arginine-tRNA-protein transferase
MNTCCPAYTIRLNASLYQISKSHKKTLKKMRKFLELPKDDVMEADGGQELTGDSQLCNLIREAEGNDTKNLKVEMVASDFDQSSYDLYCKYQMAIHNDPPEKLSQDSYRRFLIDSPISVNL